jgi:hypothetical protein
MVFWQPRNSLDVRWNEVWTEPWMAPAWKPAFELPKVDVDAIIDVDAGAVVHRRWLE